MSSSVAAKEMTRMASDSLEDQIDFDCAAQAVSIGQSCQNVLKIVSTPFQCR